MTPRQIMAVLEHGEALDRMQDARDLFVSTLGQSGNAKEITKHLKAWAEGKTPTESKRKKRATDDEAAKLLAMRAAIDKQTNGKKPPKS